MSAKTVLITGGGTGTGAAMALAFAEAGNRVFIAGRKGETLDRIAEKNKGISTIVADVTDEASVAAMFDACGAADIVIANAGAAASAPLTRTELKFWNDLIAVNLTGVFLTFREALRRMEGHDWGRLIAIASVAGLRGGPYISAYAAAKHGVIGMVRSAALEVARKGITVNAICPGYIDTEMTDRSVATITSKTGKSEADARAYLASLSPQNRLMSADEVAATALFLCAPGSQGINGQAIAINGGDQ